MEGGSRDCLILKPKDVKTAQEVEDLDVLLSMMMHVHCCEMSGAAPSILDAARRHPFVAVTVDSGFGEDFPRFRVIGFERRRDIDTGEIAAA